MLSIAGLALVAVFLYLTVEPDLEETAGEGSVFQLADPYVISLGGRQLTLEDPIYVIDDDVMVPMREVFEVVGAEVVFHPYEERAVATSESSRVSVRIDQRYALVGNTAYRMSHPSMVIEGNMYVPLDLVEEAMVAEPVEVSWEGFDEVEPQTEEEEGRR